MTYKTLDNKEWDRAELLSHMTEDSFYYGYLGKFSLSSSSLKTILKGWEYYLDELLGLSPDIPKQALRDGRLVHLAVLEPEKLPNLIITKKNKGSREFKDAVASFGEAYVYTASEHKKCLEIASNVTGDFDSFLLLDDAKKEVAGFMNYRELPFRGKADALLPAHVIDLKTTSDINRFESSIDMFDYDLQGALYLRMFGVDEFSFIPVDKRTGEVTVRRLTNSELKRGQDKLDKAIDIFNKNKHTLKDVYRAIINNRNINDNG